MVIPVSPTAQSPYPPPSLCPSQTPLYHWWNHCFSMAFKKTTNNEGPNIEQIIQYRYRAFKIIFNFFQIWEIDTKPKNRNSQFPLWNQRAQTIALEPCCLRTRVDGTFQSSNCGDGGARAVHGALYHRRKLRMKAVVGENLRLTAKIDHRNGGGRATALWCGFNEGAVVARVWQRCGGCKGLTEVQWWRGFDF